MKELGPRVEFHSHTIFSDGSLLPAALLREAEIRGHFALAITDHVDASNLKEVTKRIARFYRETRNKLPIKFIPGVELSYIIPDFIPHSCQKARRYGARLVIVHGESPAESVYPGTNHAAVKKAGLVDILAHPGSITEEDAILAAKNSVYLELSARDGHREGNRHVADFARRYGARLIVDTDCHSEKDLITQEEAFQLCKEAGLTDEEAVTTVRDNPLELVRRTERR